MRVLLRARKVRRWYTAAMRTNGIDRKEIFFKALEERLPGSGIETFYYDTLTSTNDCASAFLKEGIRPPFAVAASSQTAGRGRRGKSFFSPEGGVYCTLALPVVSAEDMPLVTVLAATAIRKGITDVTGRETKIKWVNDLFYEGKKVCGILAENLGESMLIGFGIDLVPAEMPPGLETVAGSLNSPADRYALAGACTGEIMKLISFLPDRNFLTEYRENCFLIGRSIIFMKNGRQYEAVAEKVEDSGALAVRLPDGTRMQLTSGEVSVCAK